MVGSRVPGWGRGKSLMQVTEHMTSSDTYIPQSTLGGHSLTYFCWNKIFESVFSVPLILFSCIEQASLKKGGLENIKKL